MRHPDHALLRRLLEQPAAVADADRAHVAACPACLDVLAALGDPARAGAAPRALGTTPVGARLREVRALLRRPVVVGAAVTAVLAVAGTAAATDRFAVFRTEQVAPVVIGEEDLVALPDLGAYGDVEVTGGDVHEVVGAAAARETTGLEVPEVASLPGGVAGAPALHVVDEVIATFRWSAARAADAVGDGLPPAPPGLDGSEVRMVAGPAVVQLWSHETGAPSLVVGRAVAPTATATGVSFEEARDFLLALPGVPEGLAAQLRTFAADGSTLPLPVPADGVATRTAEVAGVPATVLEADDRTMAAVVWVEDGVATLVGGALDADEVLAVARDLR